MIQSFKQTFHGKTVLITGNTGFKGAWLSAWMQRFGAQVVGVSDGVPTVPSIFREAGHERAIRYIERDIREPESIHDVLSEYRPAFVFHLAAQPLVRESYEDPVRTIQTNALGTTNLLEALRIAGHSCVAVFITSDKVYDNVEWVWGYRETDALGGKDPYSASKAMAELAIKTYVASYFSKPDSSVRVGVGRAGNVIGGGDWAKDRIVPDAARAWSEGRPVSVRNPKSTRPWQHVLEPLSGYMMLAARLAVSDALQGETFNFGPRAEQDRTVHELIDTMRLAWPDRKLEIASTGVDAPKEAGLLKLNCDKALRLLEWRPTLDFDETCRMSMSWYRKFYEDRKSVVELIADDLVEYEALAESRTRIAAPAF